MNLSKIQDKKIVSVKKPPSNSVLYPQLELSLRKSTARNNHQPSGSHKKSLIKEICQEMLINGNIDSYVNFFYLTHTTENPDEPNDNTTNRSNEIKEKNTKVLNKNLEDEEEEDEEDEERKFYEIKTYNEDKIKGTVTDLSKNNNVLSTDNLFNFNSLYVKIEECERTGNALDGYSSKKNLAEYFGRLNNWNEAINYYQKAYDSITLLKNKVELHMEAIYNIGNAYEKNNQIVKALAYYTKCRELSIDERNKNFELLASKKIVKLRLIIANKLDRKKKYEKEIEHFKKCIKIIKESYNDQDEINAISFRLGEAYYNNEELDKAITLFEEFINNADDSPKNLSNKRLAHASIADCYVSKNDLDKAIEHLEKFISFSTKDLKQKQAQIEALNKLGIIYNKRGEYKKAVVCFEKHFQLLNAIKEETANQSTKLDKSTSKKKSTTALSSLSQEKLMSGTKEENENSEENEMFNSKKISDSLDPLAVKESRSNLSSEAGNKNGIRENSKRFNEALIQMGVAKADNELKRFFTWIQKSDAPSLKSLLQWKANRSIIEYIDDDSILLNNNEKDTEDLLQDHHMNIEQQKSFEITENENNNNETENEIANETNHNETENENNSNNNENVNTSENENNNNNNNDTSNEAANENNNELENETNSDNKMK